MSRAPWEADHELDAVGARAQLRETFPELPARDVRYFAEGWDFRMFEVDGEWLFRFPKRAKEATRLQREIALLDRLDLPVAVPRYEFRAPGLAGYRKLAGAPDGPVTPAFAATLADTLSVLHATDPGDLEMPGADDTGGPAELDAAIRRGLAKARGRLDSDLYARCVAAIDVEIPAAYTRTPRLIHNDLYPEHVLLTPDGGVAAILDWADAAASDPASDFTITLFRGGARALEAALDRYTGTVDAGLPGRVRYYALGMAVGHITSGARMQDPKLVRIGVTALDRLAPPPRRPRRG